MQKKPLKKDRGGFLFLCTFTHYLSISFAPLPFTNFVYSKTTRFLLLGSKSSRWMFKRKKAMKLVYQRVNLGWIFSKISKYVE